MVGTGFTVTRKVIGAPLQPFSLGVTVIVDVWGVVTLAALSEILPKPVAGIPVAGLLFRQSNVVAGKLLLKVTAMGSLPHNTWSGTAFTVGNCPMEIGKDWGWPGQLPKVGMIVTVALCELPPTVWPTKVILLPVPDAANPTLGLLFVQA